MFTGIVQHVGLVQALTLTSGQGRLVIDVGSWDIEAVPGESIAVNGCCLSVAEPPQRSGQGQVLAFDVIAQTLAVTTLGQLKADDRVNLERAVTPSTMLGGHIVQGHIDAVAEVVQVHDEPGQRRVTIRPPADVMDCIVERGSVAIDGVSLTVAAVERDSFDVALIPTTLRETTLGSIAASQRVNIESDYIAKTVVNWLRRRGDA